MQNNVVVNETFVFKFSKYYAAVTAINIDHNVLNRIG